MEAILFPVSNLKMSRSSCGQNCSLEAKYCHKCGDLLKQNVTEGAGSVDEGSKKMKVAANLISTTGSDRFLLQVTGHRSLSVSF